MGSHQRFSERVARTTWRAIPKQALSGAIGWAAGQPIPSAIRKVVLERFARYYGIDVGEAEHALTDYARLDDFFTRRLISSARPIDPAEDAVLSPADGTVVESGRVVSGQVLQVKGVLLDVQELVGDIEAAERLAGGAYLTTYLSPQDYHRVHAPIAGGIVGWRHIPGVLFPVNARSVAREPQLFVRNERLVTFIEGGSAGFCAVVMVAAVGVGNMTAAYDADVETHGRSFLRAAIRQKRYDPTLPVARGQEIGTFHMGSTTIALFESSRVELSALVPGDRTRMGVRIGTVRSAGPRVERGGNGA
jgi:phosphatidylserine decarboxylase